LPDAAQEPCEPRADGTGKHASAHRFHVGPLPLGVVDLLAEGQVADALQHRCQAGDEKRRKKGGIEGPTGLGPVRHAHDWGSERLAQLRDVHDAE
jgi:hypothetical protein